MDTDELEEDDEHDCISLSSSGYRGNISASYLWSIHLVDDVKDYI